MPMLHPIAFSLCLSLAALPAFAQSSFFDDIDVSTETESSSLDRAWSHRGFIQQKFKYGIAAPDTNYLFERDRSGLDQVQTDAFLEINADVSDNITLRLSAKTEFDLVQWSDGELEWQINHEKLFLKDAFSDITFANGHWLRIGHQVFAWGESEALSITDVLSPTDQREFGQTELRDIREHVPALLYSLPVAQGKLSFVTTWDAGENRYADASEGFYPYITLKGSPIEISSRSPETQWEAALRYEKQFNGGDISVVLADVNDNNALALPLTSHLIATSSEHAPELVRQQKRYQTVGITANRVWGGFLLRSELGINVNQSFVNNQQDGIIKEDQLRSALSVQYSGINDWIFSYEINTIHTLASQDSTLLDKTHSFGHVLHLQNSALNDRITQHLWLFDLINEEGSIARWDIDYDWSDQWTVAAAAVIYQNDNNESSLYPYRHNDTVNVSIKYNF